MSTSEQEPGLDPERTEETSDAASEAAADPLTTARAERDKFRDQLFRTAADFDNYRKRARRDVEDAVRKTREDAIREFLPVADNLERAVAAADKAPDVQAITEGLQMVLRLFADNLERLGVTRVPAVGERFDPSLHDAIQQVETSDHPPGTIVAELVPGYRFGDRLLRAAMVAVAKAKPAPATESSESN